MDEPFFSSQYSLEHAKRRLAEFEREVSAFFDPDPYAKVMEHNADGTEDVYKIKLVKPMPVSLPGIAFDTITNLRSSLDQAGFAAATACGRDGRNAKFPFGRDLADIDGKVRGHARGTGRSKDIPKEIFSLMVSFKPYKGGNNLLWALNKLCNSQKHEMIVPAVMYSGGGYIENVTFSRALAFQFPPIWDRAKNEMVVARVPHGAPTNLNFQFAAFIALAQVDVVGGQPAIGVLRELVGIVEGIIMAVEAETRRLGLIT